MKAKVEKALEQIRETESHNRSLYTGFLGPWNIMGSTTLFVNLRCAKIEESSLCVFTGGGLTAKSDPEEEWKETENKSRTMLNVLEKL